MAHKTAGTRENGIWIDGKWKHSAQKDDTRRGATTINRFTRWWSKVLESSKACVHVTAYTQHVSFFNTTRHYQDSQSNSNNIDSSKQDGQIFPH